MKPYRILIALLLILTLGACGNATPTPTDEDVLLDVYTAAAMTFSVQSNSIAAQSTPTLVSPPTPFPSPVASSTANAYPTGTSSSYTAISTGCYSSAYVSDVTIDDGTEIAPGELFVKTWRLKNTGGCAWDNDYLLTFYSGDDMEGDGTEIGQYVASGDTVDVSVTLAAPDADGEYTGYWILADNSGTFFGAIFYVQIVVSSDLATFTPTSTSTGSSTSTSTSTPTPTSIDLSTSTSTPTTAPSNTPTPTQIETSTPDQGNASTILAWATTINPDDSPGVCVVACKDMT